MSQKTSSCVREAVEQIEDLQNAVEEDCPTGCHSKLLSVNHSLGDTVPFAIFTSKSKPLVAFGNVGELDNGPCFNTVFFRVEKVHGSCATLSLLIAFDEHKHILDFTDKDTVCEVFRLEKTNYCIEVDLDCFCAINCLNPRLINRTHHHS
ncbi:spore coat protein [Bacillus mojavensis]|uniref:Spore coat protein CotZ n=1 Tax=Bacillus mojavensis TaxID=72360 RepID=A0AAP3CTN9_BACMO|nr:spore coat protein CotZ [Bacillus mojavensis]MCY8103355.1 spore coat protein CotZ [Bacillus mojavensis]MCY8481477.1 spore coat protein CotZ [Bacillus mojavensis]MCY8510784.1 spore coat protein CotZ [Bacillus mojavensis]MDR4227185.1 spore coat protein [Bacillus mojavensis]MEC1670620.1 spore coat protein CotZ [Bacillus mojavensis]